MKKLLGIFCAGLLSCLTASAEQSISDGLIYYLPFDGDLKPAFSAGVQDSAKSDKALSYAAGIKKQAAVIEDNTVSFMSGGNFEYTEGTLALWFKPSSLEAGKDSYIIDTENFKISFQKDRVFFMTGRTLEKSGYKWDYGVSIPVKKLKKDKWNHIAISWDAFSGEKKFYIDGFLESSAKTQYIRDDKYSNKPFRIGNEMPGLYDEFMIWKRVLSEAEIMKLAGENPEIKTAPQVIVSKADISIVPVSDPVKSVVEPGGNFSIRFRMKNESRNDISGSLKLTVTDFHGKAVVDAGSLPCVLRAGAERTFESTVKAPALNGPYKVTASSELLKSNVDVSSFAVWPLLKKALREDSFFGNHINSYTDRYLEQGNRLGLGWTRVHDMNGGTWWVKVQPEPGAFVWNDCDEKIERVRTNNMLLLGAFFSTPYWAGKDGPGKPFGKGYPPAINPDPEHFRNYVKETVKHCKGFIKYWETWNEPDVSMFWRGSPAEFANICKVAYETAKAADPSCKVMVGGLTAPSWKWHEEAAKAGSLKYCDILSYHEYFNASDEPEEIYQETATLLEHFRSLSEKYGNGRNVEIWNTEGGITDDSWLNGLEIKDLPPEDKRGVSLWKKATYRMLQLSAIQMQLGIKKHFYYFQNNSALKASFHTAFNMLDINEAPRPKLMARVAMQNLLDDAVISGDFRKKEGRFWAFFFSKPDKSSYALVWCGESGELKLPAELAKSSSVIDIFGNPVVSPSWVATEEPFYIKSSLPVSDLKKIFEKGSYTLIKEAKPFEAKKEESSELKMEVLPDYAAPKENATGVFSIDLKSVCNMGFADEAPGDGKGGWTDEGPYNDLRDMKSGTRKFYGVPFDVINPASNGGKSVITLKSANTLQLPEKVRIDFSPVKVRCLYFLQSAGWGVPGKSGRYEIIYKDGSKEVLQLEIPVNNNNWWFAPAENEISRAVPVKVSNTLTGKPAWRYLRVLEWENPKKEKEISAIEFISDNGPQIAVLLAISGVKF